MSTLIALAYIASAAFFIVGLKMLGKAATAVRGNMISAIGMLIAVIATLLNTNLIHDYTWIIAGILVGGAIGMVAAARVPMTSMPEFVALFNGTGGLASLLVGWAEYHHAVVPKAGAAADAVHASVAAPLPIFFAVFIGGVTFTGSILAYLKLSERIDGKPVLFTGQQVVNLLVLLVALGSCAMFAITQDYQYLIAGIVVSLIFGVLATIPIGGADMPVVISLLNSYSGLAACAAGFAIGNTVLIVAGSLVGASGFILTQIMCKAMNRSLSMCLQGFGSRRRWRGGETGK